MKPTGRAFFDALEALPWISDNRLRDELAAEILYVNRHLRRVPNTADGPVVTASEDPMDQQITDIARKSIEQRR